MGEDAPFAMVASGAIFGDEAAERKKRMSEQIGRYQDTCVELVLALRAAFLKEHPSEALKHWDQLKTRIQSTLSMTSTPESFLAKLVDKMRIEAPPVRLSKSCLEFATAARGLQNWRQEFERTLTYIIARARVKVDEARDDEAKSEPGVKPKRQSQAGPRAESQPNLFGE